MSNEDNANINEQSSIETARAFTKRITLITAVFYLAVIVTYCIWFGYTLKYGISKSSTEWGMFGDFIGGTINPAISLATLLIVALAYLAQRQELSDTISALSESAKEQSRHSSISILRGQLDGKTALLHRKSENLNGIRSEIGRLASVEHSAGSDDVTVFSFRGVELNGKAAIQEELRAFRTTVTEAVDQIQNLEGEINDLLKNINDLSLPDVVPGEPELRE